MPREKQKRGRRAETKQKLEANRKRDEPTDAEGDVMLEDVSAKRLKPSTADGTQDSGCAIRNGDDFIPLEDNKGFGANEDGRYEGRPDDMPFYGLLDEEEQEYFSHASQMLELDQFESEEDRQTFVTRVYEEASGKELKVACSQSCSRLMERLIELSTTTQLKRLFIKFSGNFLNLAQHRFASHCCECLFVHSAPVISREMATKGKKDRKPHKKAKKQDETMDETPDDVKDTQMEDLFLNAITEFQGNLGYLFTERFASHTLRVLLLVLAGEPLDNLNSLVASKAKESTDRTKHVTRNTDATTAASLSQRRPVPSSFTNILNKLIQDFVSGLDDTYLRMLATHPLGNPVLQVLLALELTVMGKSRGKDSNSLIRKFVPDEEDLQEGSASREFLVHLLYDPVGSRLLETIIRHAPGKMFKGLFRGLFRDQVGSFARNEIAAYVIVRVLERVSKEDLESVMEAILKEIPALVERSRLVVIRVMIERGLVRGANLDPLANALESAYGEDPKLRLEKMLYIETDENDTKESERRNDEKKGPVGFHSDIKSPQQKQAEKVHGSLLAQVILTVPGSLSSMIQQSLLSIDPTAHLIPLATQATTSHVLQRALTAPTSTTAFRRQFTNRFTGHVANLAVDTSGSHVVDTLWTATRDLIFMKQRFADELVRSEHILRDSFVGRAVWRNWSLDLYKRRRGQWMAIAKESKDEHSSENADSNNAPGEKEKPQEEVSKKKSPLDRARERFAAKEKLKNPTDSKTSAPPPPPPPSNVNQAAQATEATEAAEATNE